MDRRQFLLLMYAGPLVLFSAEDGAVLEALCDQIIPADDVPGAKAAGVVFYIDKQLAGPLARFAGDYRRGLAAIGAEFAKLPFAEQTRRIESIDRAFFDLVVDHTMQGFYGHPDHGGNRDEMSWKMLGIQDLMGGHKH